MKVCTHEEYKLSPVFIGPYFEKKHVRFSTSFELPKGSLSFFQYRLPELFGCKERQSEVVSIFDCMQHLYPAPPGWGISTSLFDSLGKQEKNTYCVEDGKAVITYERPERNLGDYQDILKDICEGYVIVASYNRLSRSSNFSKSQSEIPYYVMKDDYDSNCLSAKYLSKSKPASCSSEYRYEHKGQCKYYKMDCSEGILREGIANSSCKESATPEYKISRDSYSYHGDLARLAAISYQDRIMMLDGDWVHIGRSSENSDGFFGHAFTNDNLKVTAIVFRGTDDLSKDWIGSNICFAPPGCRPSQYKVALEFFDSVVFKEGYDIIVSGHSLGGALAQLVSVARDVKAVTFDSPGTYYAAKHLFYSGEMFSANDKITSYIFGFNLVNSAGKHIIDPMKITRNVIEDCDKFFAVGNTLSQHDMPKAAEEYFDRISGRPLYAERVSKEELCVSYAKKRFSEQCKRAISALQEDLFSCAKMLFETSGVLSHRDHIAIFADNIRMKKYLPVLKKANGPCGLVSTEQITEEEYERRIELSKVIAVDQANWDLPMPIEDSEARWSEYSYSDILDVHVLDFLVNLNRDSSYYTEKVLENEYVRQRYTVTDCRDPNTQPTICKTAIGITDSHEEL